ncbi:MAG: hypothetical protein GKR77_06165 [Legionellales bacterium]|nr:hypothetical protein [Legionellales bacterium]
MITYSFSFVYFVLVIEVEQSLGTEICTLGWCVGEVQPYYFNLAYLLPIAASLRKRTRQAYCEQSGISYRSFVYQHHRLSSQSKPSSIDFVETKSAPTIRHQAVGGLQLLLPNGIRISISNEANLQLLKSVLALAGDVRC